MHLDVVAYTHNGTIDARSDSMKSDVVDVGVPLSSRTAPATHGLGSWWLARNEAFGAQYKDRERCTAGTDVFPLAERNPRTRLPFPA